MSAEASTSDRPAVDPANPSISVRGWMVAGAAAAGSWLGWPALAPLFGFPAVAPAAMVDRALAAAGAPLGWGPIVVVVGLGLLAGVYSAAAGRRVLRATPASGILYGAVMWLVAGAILMPLMGLAAPAASWGADPAATGMAAGPVSEADSMRPTFMMLHLGPLAPIGALIAWVMFGAILGTAPAWLWRLRVR